MKHGAAVLRDPASRRLRALMMLDRKIKGMTVPAIAQEFRVSPDTVKDTLSWARKAGLVAQHEDEILQTLIPLATQAISTLLADADNPVEAAKVALELYKGMLPGFGKHKAGSNTPKVTDRDELADYINNLRGGNSGDRIIEGEVSASPLEIESAEATLSVQQGLLRANQDESHREDSLTVPA